jgi:hypothetical protein
MKRPLALALAAGVAAIALVAGVLVPRTGRRARTYRLLDSLAAVPLGMPLDSLRRAFPWLYCPKMTHHVAEHILVCTAEVDGRDVRFEVPSHRVGTTEVMVFGRDMPNLVAWARARLGTPGGRCTLDDTRLAWWSLSGTTVTLTEPPPGGRARRLVIRAGGGAPPGCA